MKLFNTTAKCLLFAGILLVVAAPRLAAADDFCPSVYPCDDAGELLEMYEGKTDECSLRFAAQCKRVRAEDRKSCAAVSDLANDLQVKLDNHKSQLVKAQRQIRKLRTSKKK